MGFARVQSRIHSIPSIRNDAAESSANAAICARLVRSNAATAEAEQFPSTIPMTLGGCPNAKLRCWKSASLVTIHSPCNFVCSHTIASLFDLSPRSYTCTELGKSDASAFTRLGDKFSSKSSLTPTYPSIGAHDQRQTPDTRECRSQSDRDTRPESASRSCPMRDSPTRRRPSREDRVRMVCHCVAAGRS
jgi:hypothetical protein